MEQGICEVCKQKKSCYVQRSNYIDKSGVKHHIKELICPDCLAVNDVE